MSAYLCEAAHISALANAVKLVHHMDDRRLESYLKPETLPTVYQGINTPREALFSDLLQANLDSLAARYPEHGKQSDWTSDYGYRYDSRAMFGSVVEAIKGAHCYRYQSCEHEGWKDSLAARFIDHLIEELISVLPGYSDAAWGYEPHYPTLGEV